MTQLLVEYGQKVVLSLTSAPPHPGPSSFPGSGPPVHGASAGYPLHLQHHRVSLPFTCRFQMAPSFHCDTQNFFSLCHTVQVAFPVRHEPILAANRQVSFFFYLLTL